MGTTLGDRLGSLSAVVIAPWDWQRIRLLCFTCGREDHTRSFEECQIGPDLHREQLARENFEVLCFGRTANQPQEDPRIGLIVPLAKLLHWRPDVHLLHEIRPFIDRRWYGKPINVQDVSTFTKTPLADVTAYYNSSGPFGRR